MLLEVEGLRCGYADGVEVLHGVDLVVGERELVTLIGANGAGKTTTLRAIMGLVAIGGGVVRFDGASLSGRSTAGIAGAGIALVPEGRGVFPGLSVDDNLRVAATRWLRKGSRRELAGEMERVFGLFPMLAERRRQAAWSLSGGQQQMLAIGRALVSRPRLMLLDEPSLGLAPNLVEQMFETLVEINRQGVSILLVEQNAYLALEISRRAYVIERGGWRCMGMPRRCWGMSGCRRLILGGRFLLGWFFVLLARVVSTGTGPRIKSGDDVLFCCQYVFVWWRVK